MHDPDVEEMGITEVRELLEQLMEARFQAPFSEAQQILWVRLLFREAALLAPPIDLTREPEGSPAGDPPRP